MNYIENATQVFRNYKALAERAMAQMSDEHLGWHPNEESNSINTIVKHLNGNMLSRWTDFLTTDGEKEWRQRDEEFEPENFTREMLMAEWEEGWSCLFNALSALTDADLDKTVTIRSEQMPVVDAINRQIAHYASHVGQIIYIAKICASQWTALTIPKNGSAAFNQQMAGKK